MRLKYLGPERPFYTHTGGMPTKWDPEADVPEATGQMLLSLKDRKGKPRFELMAEIQQASVDIVEAAYKALEDALPESTMEEPKEEIKAPSSPAKKPVGRPRKVR